MTFLYKRIALIILTGALAWLCGCSTHSVSNNDRNTNGPLPIDRTTPVEVSIARKGIFHYRIVCNGDIRAAHIYQITSQTSGIVQICKARDGAYFQKGALILQLETAPLKLQLQKTKVALLNAQAAYQSRLLGYQSLLKDKTQDEIKTIKLKLQAGTGLAQAKLDQKNALWNLQQAAIYAPASGIVANVEINEGMQVTPGERLFTLYTVNNLLADVLVLEEDAGQVQKGQTATITPVGHDSKSYSAVVEDINPVVDANGMVIVHLKLKETKGLFPGMHVSAVIEVPKNKAIIVPKNAVVLRSGDRPVVFTIHDSLAQWHYVKTGLDNGQEVEILDGISPGDTVITSNNIQLAHDAPVSIENAEIIPDKD